MVLTWPACYKKWFGAGTVLSHVIPCQCHVIESQSNFNFNKVSFDIPILSDYTQYLIKSYMPFPTLCNLCTSNVEVLWLKPRPYWPYLVKFLHFVRMTYHLPLGSNNVLQDYLIQTVDKLLSKHPNAGIMLMVISTISTAKRYVVIPS